MTPPESVRALGTKTAADALAARGITLGTHPADSALNTLSTLITETVDSVDGIQQQLLANAETASRTLERVITGRDTVYHGSTDGLLQHTGVAIDMLVARRGEGIRLLRMLITSYADLRAAQEQPPPPPPAPIRAARRSRT
ncbi:hypothetical protein [Streptomyces sp. NPDC059604]|uniref:hypothetical protein n=1 Tax=Streptomyces sp. NPDC059604 TaxID=3346881 RepID=UPI0036A78B2D